MDMQKDFDTWNIQKKDIHENEAYKWCNERDIWWCRLGVNIGYEQDGKGDTHLRPILVVKKFNKFVALAVPLSTVIKSGPYYVALNNKRGVQIVAIVSQLRLVDTKRFFKKVERISSEDFKRIRKAITDLFL
jgi:mRNA interferase MazF